MTDAEAMGMALAVARNALGATGGNPAVGAVIVRDGQVLARGWTQPPGRDHAEPHALRQCDARGATLYVTLEPCCHFGRTPPCTDAILAADVRRVVVGTVDPFPLVAGKGIAQLRAAGLQVDVGIEEAACLRSNRGFLRVLAGGLPEVTLKAGVSMDGRIASVTGESKWITSPEARADAHRLRAEHDAIIVGSGTVLADDPELTVRLPGVERNPLRVVLDRRRRVGAEARLLPAVLVREGGERDAGGEMWARSLAGVLQLLAARGVRRVLVEGGGEVHRGFLDAGLVDRVELYVAGKVLAGGPGFVGGPGFGIATAPGFSLAGVARIGPDAHLSWERTS